MGRLYFCAVFYAVVGDWGELPVDVMREVSISTSIPERFLTGQCVVADAQPDEIETWCAIRSAISAFCFSKTRRDLLSFMVARRRKKRDYTSFVMRVSK
jgi:hypothetical protein